MSTTRLYWSSCRGRARSHVVPAPADDQHPGRPGPRARPRRGEKTRRAPEDCGRGRTADRTRRHSAPGHPRAARDVHAFDAPLSRHPPTRSSTSGRHARSCSPATAALGARADIEWMRDSVELATTRTSPTRPCCGGRSRDHTCPAPVTAAVHGHALGGGPGLVAVADIAIAHERTAFAFSEVKLGITPGGDLAVRASARSARAQRAGTPHGRALRRGRRAAHRARPRGDRRPRRSLDRVLGELRTAGPRAARHAKRLVLDRPTGRRRPGASQSGARATRARRACGRSWRDACRAGPDSRRGARQR